MATARPVAGVGLGDQSRFGLANTQNDAATIAPAGWSDSRSSISHSVYYTDQNGAAVWFSFEYDSDTPIGQNAVFSFGGAPAIGGASLDEQATFGIPRARNAAQHLNAKGTEHQILSIPRLWESNDLSSANNGGRVDFNHIDQTPLNNGNTAFYFGGTLVVAAVSLGEILNIDTIADIEQPLQLKPKGKAPHNSYGLARLGDQAAVEFNFDTVHNHLDGRNVALTFGGNATATLGDNHFTQFGYSRISNGAQQLHTSGNVNSTFGRALVFDIDTNGTNLNLSFTQDYKPKPSALNTPFYFAWESRALAEGWHSHQFGAATTWLFHSYGDPKGWNDTQFGQHHIENWAEFAATPYGIAPAGFGETKLVVAPRYQLALNATLPTITTLSASAHYQSLTARPTTSQTVNQWNVTKGFENNTSIKQQDTQKAPKGWWNPWQKSLPHTNPLNHRLPPALTTIDHGKGQNQQRATPLHQRRHFAQQDATNQWLNVIAAQQNGTTQERETRFKQQDGIRNMGGQRQTDWHLAAPTTRRHNSDFQAATRYSNGWGGYFESARRPPPGISRIQLSNIEPDETACYEPSTHLIFAALQSHATNLLFACDSQSLPPPSGGSIIISIQRVYVVLNDVNLIRVSDQQIIPTLSASLSLDAGSWVWGFEASLPGSAQAAVEPTNDGPVELSVWVNGTEFRVFAEQISRERTFGNTQIRVSGRGIHAQLDQPYAPIKTFNQSSSRTHQQLLGDVLTDNSVSLGWTIEYGLEDWNVPAGVFNHQGTYISALAALTKAAGAYLVPHPSNKSFAVKPRYPIAPWDWGAITSDIVLPANVVSRESIRWLEKPNYNRVFVSGQQQGILGQITKAGTASDLTAPMLTDALITDVIAARQLGMSILADTGKQREIQIKLPVLSTTGIIQPGLFVRYQEPDGTQQLGLVRSTNIEIGLPDVYQTLGLECHA